LRIRESDLQACRPTPEGPNEEDSSNAVSLLMHYQHAYNLFSLKAQIFYCCRDINISDWLSEGKPALYTDACAVLIHVCPPKRTKLLKPINNRKKKVKLAL
jgi:hypothetical protein